MSRSDGASRIGRLLAQRLAVTLREPRREPDLELRIAIARARIQTRSPGTRAKPSVRVARGRWDEVCRHSDDLADLLPSGGEVQPAVVARLAATLERSTGSTRLDAAWFDCAAGMVEILLCDERQLLESLLPVIVRIATKLAERGARLDVLIRHGLCAVADAVWACGGQASAPFDAYVLEPLLQSMYEFAAVIPGRRVDIASRSVLSPVGQPRRLRRAQGREVVPAPGRSTMEVCTSVGSRDEVRAVLCRFSDPLALGEDPPLARLMAYLPLVYGTIVQLRPDQLVVERWLGEQIGQAQRWWTLLHPRGVRRYPDDDPRQLARRWLHPSSSRREDTQEVQPDPDPCWDEVPPITDTQQDAELHFLLALTPFAVQRSLFHSRTNQSVSRSVVLGLHEALQATMIPRSGRVPMIDYAVLQRIDKVARVATGRADELWWVDDVPEDVERRLDYLARRVSRGELASGTFH